MHIPSHLALTRRVGRSPVPASEPACLDERFDCVIVPAGRPGKKLTAAARVAQQAARHLVVFCSQNCTPDEAEAAIAHADLRVPAFVVDASELRSPVDFRCEDVLFADAPCQADTSLKRNAGLRLARQLGWSSALFLDDDVRDLNADELRRALRVLRYGRGTHGRPCRVAGWNFPTSADKPSSPDNSVVCHAYRESSGAAFGEQETFIGGGGLAVRIDRRVSFFPRVYNEDWLFMYRDLLDRSVAHMGSLLQDTYDPFDRTEVARQQEFGDLLGEGLFAAAHDRRHDPRTTRRIKDPDYWAAFIERRRQFIGHIGAHLDLADPDRAERIRSVLNQSSDALCRIRADRLASVVSRFDEDLDTWHEHLAGLDVYWNMPTAEAIQRSLEPLRATVRRVMITSVGRRGPGRPLRRR